MPKRIEGGSSPHKEGKFKQYISSNKRYKNKVNRATKRYKNSPKVLDKVLKQIVKHRKGFNKQS